MELLLNLAWLFVAGTLVCLWIHGKAQGKPDWRLQLISIAVLIAILFPVISMSDDLLATQTAFESDNFLRRDHLVPADSHPVQPALVILATAIFAGSGFAFSRFAAAGILPVYEPEHPELAGIDNRPPPAA